jgi:hypothetical protein
MLRDAIIDCEDGHWLACGPCVVAALTGSSLTWDENLFRWEGLASVATPASDLDRVLRWFNLSLELGYVADWGREPPLWRCLRHRPEDQPLIIAIQTEDGSHWVATHGWWLGRCPDLWPMDRGDDHGLHADCKVETVWVVLGR